MKNWLEVLGLNDKQLLREHNKLYEKFNVLTNEEREYYFVNLSNELNIRGIYKKTNSYNSYLKTLEKTKEHNNKMRLK